ncbi:MAG: hypothetical protein AAF849_24680 [Bacteroidota bacterium]
MKLFISAVNYSIPFAPKDPDDLRYALAEAIGPTIRPSKKYEEKFGNANLDMIAVLERKTKELEIKGPTVDSELVDFGIWLPYKKMKNSSNYRLSYFNYFCEGILTLLRKYDFDTLETEKAIDELRKKLFQAK